MQAGRQTADIFSFTLLKYVRNAPTSREPAAVQIQLAVKSKNAADFIFSLHFEQAAPLTVKTTQGVPGFALVSSLRLHMKLFLSKFLHLQHHLPPPELIQGCLLQ